MNCPRESTYGSSSIWRGRLAIGDVLIADSVAYVEFLKVTDKAGHGKAQGKPDSDKQSDTEGAVDMVSSQDAATATALRELGYPVEIGTDMRRGGMSVPRLHTDVGRQGGQRFVRRLREAMAAVSGSVLVDRFVEGGGLLRAPVAGRASPWESLRR